MQTLLHFRYRWSPFVFWWAKNTVCFVLRGCCLGDHDSLAEYSMMELNGTSALVQLYTRSGQLPTWCLLYQRGMAAESCDQGNGIWLCMSSTPHMSYMLCAHSCLHKKPNFRGFQHFLLVIQMQLMSEDCLTINIIQLPMIWQAAGTHPRGCLSHQGFISMSYEPTIFSSESDC